MFALDAGIDALAEQLRASTAMLTRAEAEFIAMCRQIWHAESVELPGIAEQRTALREVRYAATDPERAVIDAKLDALADREDQLRRFLAREQPGIEGGIEAARKRRADHAALRDRFLHAVSGAGQRLLEKIAPAVRAAVAELASWHAAIAEARITAPIAGPWLSATRVPDLTTPGTAYAPDVVAGWAYSGPGLLADVEPDERSAGMRALFEPIRRLHGEAGAFRGDFTEVLNAAQRTWRTPVQAARDAELLAARERGEHERAARDKAEADRIAAAPKFQRSQHSPPNYSRPNWTGQPSGGDLGMPDLVA